MSPRSIERWAPLVLLVVLVVLWEVVCTAFDIPEYIFPSPTQIYHALAEFTGPIAYAAWQTGATAGFTPVAGGNNFAVGGARVDLQPGSLNDFPLLRPFIPPVSAQVSDFLARGPVDAKALYALLGGSNDIFVQATRVSGGGSPEVAQAAVLTAANAMTAQVARLQSAGVRHLIVIGVPDIGRTPAAGSLPPAGAALLTSLTATYDAALVAGLAGRNLLFFDGNRLFNAIFADPGAYGFTNTTTPVCPGSPPDALACVAAPDGHLFADAVHWTSSLHRVISDWVYASLEGASRVGLLSLVPIGRSGAQWRSIDDRLQQFENFGYQGQGFFVTGDLASSRKDAHDGLPSAHGSGGSFVIGYEKAFSEQLFGGVLMLEEVDSWRMLMRWKPDAVYPWHPAGRDSKCRE